MKSYKPIQKITHGSCLTLYNCVNLNFKFNPIHRVLIKGHVFNPNHIPIENAGVEVVRMNTSTNTTTSLGVIFTDKNGEYAVSLETNPNYDYYFNAYSPA